MNFTVNYKHQIILQQVIKTFLQALYNSITTNAGFLRRYTYLLSI